MGVNNVNGSNSVEGAHSTSGSQAVVSTLMGDVVVGYDEQIKEFQKELDKTNDEKQAYRDTKYEFNAIADGVTDTVNSSNEACVQISPQDYKVLCDVAIANGAQKSIPKNGIPLEGGTIYQFTQEEFDTFTAAVTEKIDTKLENLNSLSDLKLMKFQSLMDARKQAMMMLTNTMQSESQMNQQIIGNMKA